MRKKKHIKIPENAAEKAIFLSLKHDGVCEIKGVGTLEVVEIKGRKTHNPQTGGEAYMEPYKKVKFRASTDLNSYLN